MNEHGPENDPTYWTGLCTNCGDEWQEDERPVVCPECGFTGVVAIPPKATGQ